MQSEYDSIVAINISTLKRAWGKSPRHYLHAIDHPQKPTEEMQIGTATHVRILEPARFDGLYVAKPDGLNLATKEGRAWRADNAAGRATFSAEQMARIEGMARAVSAHPFAAKYLGERGKAEHPIYWDDEETGARCKGRLDLWTDSHRLVGLKTASDISERRYYSQAARLGYHLQWAFYYDGLCAIGTPPVEVVEVAVESFPPHDVAVDIITDETIDEGRQAYREALATIIACRERQDWPGQAPQPRIFRLPDWALSADVDDLSDLDFGEKGAAA